MITRSIVEGSDPTPLKIFYSYARAESELRSDLDSKLAEFQWDVLVEPWYDGNIAPGDEWAEEIRRNLEAADVVLLFVTNAFMNSDYCTTVEVPQAIQRHASGQARVIPIILEDTDPDWRKAPFSKFQALPQNGLPISRWPNREQAFRQVTQAIINIIVRQGIKNCPKTKWKMVLDGDERPFTPGDELAIVKSLRDFSGDEGLRPVELPQKSTLLLESSGDALQKVQTGVQTGQFSLPGWTIRLIMELFGAAVQSRVETVAENAAAHPQPAPDPEAVLFPGEEAHATVITFLSVEHTDKAHFKMRFDDGTGVIPLPRLQPEVQARLMDYFFTGLAVKNEEVWVNLGPDEKNRMLPETLGGTRLGRVMIEQDYQLKRLCASLLHPDCGYGRDYWSNVFGRAQSALGTTNLPYTSFFRVWIVPDNINILEQPDAEMVAAGKGYAEIGEARLKVLSDREFLGTYAGAQSSFAGVVNDLCYAAFEETILPVVNREVRLGATWVPIREAFNSLVLSSWYKARFGNQPVASKFIENHKPMQIDLPGAGVTYSNMNVPENKEFFEKYMSIFKNGVFYTVRDDYDVYSNQKYTRAYFAGAIDFSGLWKSVKVSRAIKAA